MSFHSTKRRKNDTYKLSEKRLKKHKRNWRSPKIISDRQRSGVKLYFNCKALFYAYTISIQEIARRATVNRATFYAHFEDKYALMADWSREKFQRGLVCQFPASSTLQRETLHRLILAVFDFLALSRRYSRPSNRQFEQIYEIAIQQELYVLLLRWLKQTPSEIPRPVETIETTMQAISWAIFGPAAQWSRGDQNISKEVMAHHVLAVVVAGLSPVVTVT